jgi:hypothetical protein
MTRRSALVALAVICVAFSACQKKVDPRLTIANFEKIQVGMDRTEVESLLGNDFNESPDGELYGGTGGAAVGIADPMALQSSGTQHKWVQWGNDKHCILVCFAHNKVTATKPVGLK